MSVLLTAPTGRRAVTLALAAGVCLALAGCDTSPGTVTRRYTTQVGGKTSYWVQVHHAGSGRTTTEPVTGIDWATCAKGTAWPACAR